MYMSSTNQNRKTEKQKKRVDLCLVCSAGGHLNNLCLIKPFWEQHDRVWVTFDRPDSRSALPGETIYGAYYPSNRSLKALVINTVRAFRIISKERPKVIISSGAAPAVPFFYVGKLFGAKLIYIEVIDNYEGLSMSGRICYPVADVFVVQWKDLTKKYRKAVCFGKIF